MHRPASTRNFMSIGLEWTQWPSPGPWCYRGHGTTGRGAEDGEEEPGPWRRRRCEAQVEDVLSPVVPTLVAGATSRDCLAEARDPGRPAEGAPATDLRLQLARS